MITKVENISTRYETTTDMETAEIFTNLKQSIMLALKDTTGDMAYERMYCIIADIDVLEDRLSAMKDSVQEAREYFHRWNKADAECKMKTETIIKLQKKIEKLESNKEDDSW